MNKIDTILMIIAIISLFILLIWNISVSHNIETDINSCNEYWIDIIESGRTGYTGLVPSSNFSLNIDEGFINEVKD